MSKGLYIKLPAGGYQCPVCQATFKPGFRFDAQNCCRELKAGIIPPQPANLAYSPHFQAPGAGYEFPDSDGRWRQGKTPDQKKRLVYMRALYNLEKRAKQTDYKQSLKYYLDHLFEHDAKAWGRKKRTPLQRLAWAFLQGNWEQVKHCAYQLAYDHAVKEHITKWRSKILDLDNLFSLDNELQFEYDHLVNAGGLDDQELENMTDTEFWEWVDKQLKDFPEKDDQ